MLRLLVPALVALAAGCSSEIHGAAPILTSISSTEVCDQQVTTTVTITGDGFEPLVVGALTSGQRVVLPSVTLTGSDGKAVAEGNVVFVSSTELTFDITSALGLTSGMYTVTVTNPDGSSGSLATRLTLADPPTVTSVVPVLECNAVSNVVLINGTGFLQGTNGQPPSVTFGGMTVPSSDITFTGAMQLMLVVPAETLQVGGPYDVKVENADGCQGTAYAAFTEVPPPVLTAVQPSLVCSAIDDVVTLSGMNFRDTPTVAIGTTTLQAADVRFVSSTTLVVSIPAGAIAQSSTPYDVTVINPEGQVHCSSTLAAALTIVPPPTLSNVAPQTTCPYPTRPASLSITGTGFRQGATVDIGSNPLPPAAVTVALDGTAITVAVPPGLPVGGPYDVTVVNNEGCAATLPVAYTVNPPPDVLSISTSEICSGATSPPFTIAGTDFQTGAMVTIGTVTIPAADLTITPTSITVSVPAGMVPAGGPYDVTVHNPDACSSTLPASLTVSPQPRLFYANPPVLATCGGGGASTVSLYGQDFQPGGNVTFTPDPTACPSVVTTTLAGTYVDAGLYTVLVPVTLPSCSNYRVTVTDPDGCTAPMATSYSVTTGASVTVTGISPSSAYNAAPTPVTITGTGFGSSASVVLTSIGALSGVSVVNANTITATIPPGIAAGIYTVTVTSPVGGCSATTTYTATSTPAFTLSKVTPPFGCIGADTNVTITTTAAGGFQSTPRVYLHDITQSATSLIPIRHVGFINSTTITADIRGSSDGKTPPGTVSVGSYDVIVVNPDGTGSTLAYNFSTGYTETTGCPPQITSVTPNQLASGSTSTVQIAGRSFTAGATVSFVPQTGAPLPMTVGSVSPTVITFTLAGAVPTGVYLVQVTNPDMTFGQYAAFVVSQPSNKLSAWTNETTANGVQLNTGRRALASAVGTDDLGNKFLYAVGGESATGAPLASVEVAPISLFGGLGSFASTHALSTARTGLVLVSSGAQGKGTYLYAIGGSTAGVGTGLTSAAAIGSIEKAHVLETFEAPALPADPTTTAGGSLAGGTWYYKVSAVYPSGQLGAGCPSYESLPSDEGIVTTDLTNHTAVVAWSGTFPAGTTFTVYRTPMANGISGTEVLLASGVTSTSYTDSGSAAPGATKPQASGALTTWCTVSGGLTTARVGASIAIAPNPVASSTGSIVYVLFGASGPGTFVTNYESATLSADGSTLGAFSAGATLSAPAGRAFAQAQYFPDPNALGAPTIYLMGGQTSLTGATASDPRAYQIAINTTTGQLPSAGFASYGPQLSSGECGAAMLIENGNFYVFGGQLDLGTAPTTQGVLSVMAKNGAPGPFSSASVALPAADALMGSANTGAFEYLVGGTSTGTDATSVVYSTIY